MRQFLCASVLTPTRLTSQPVSQLPESVPARLAASDPLCGAAIVFTHRIRLVMAGYRESQVGLDMIQRITVPPNECVLTTMSSMPLAIIHV